MAATTLTPKQEDDLIDELEKLFGALLPRTGDEMDQAKVMSLYFDAFLDLPFEKLKVTMRLFRIGKLGDGRYLPMPGEIRREVEREDREAAERAQEAARLAERAAKEAAERERRECEHARRMAEYDRRIAEQLAERRAAAERRKNLAPGAFARADALMQRFRESLPADPLKSAKKPYSEITRDEAEHNLKTIRERVGGFCDLSDELRQRLCLPTHAEEAERDAARDDYEEE